MSDKSDTPRTSAAAVEVVQVSKDRATVGFVCFAAVPVIDAKQLERELNAAKERIAKLETAPCQNLEKCAAREQELRQMREMCANFSKETGPTAYAVRNDQGYWIGIWNDSKTAKEIVERGKKKGQAAHNEQVVPLVALPALRAHDAEVETKVLEEAAESLKTMTHFSRETAISTLKIIAAERRKEGE